MMFSDIDSDVSFNSIKIEEEFIEELKNYNKNSNLNKKDYRNRIDKLYDEIGEVKPIDNEINDVLYFDDYEENGLVLNKKDISFKQIWTEYRLIYNEKKLEDDNVMENKNSFVLDNFDELYDRISNKVDGVDKYINDLNTLKKEIGFDTAKLEDTKASLELEKINFENYRRSEIARLDNLEKELNQKIEKINNLMVIFDKKMNEFMNND